MLLARKLFPYLSGKWLEAPLDLATESEKLPSEGDNPVLDPAWCGSMLAEFHKAAGANYSYGGYMEDRTKFLRGHYFDPDKPIIHLGVDYWVPQDSWVHLPKKGRLVLLEQHPDQYGGWGGRAVYEIDGLWVIFAHLYNLIGQVDRIYNSTIRIGQVAPVGKNGGWFPHLHIQCCRDYNTCEDGYSTCRRETDFPDPETTLV